MRRRSFLALSGGFCVCGCAGAVHRLPQIDGGSLSMAQGEVQAAGAPQRRAVSDQEVDELDRSIVRSDSTRNLT